MKALTAEWVEKAEGDLHSCLREVRARQHPNPDSACFQTQQCAEKYLQARLQEAGLAFPKTHDLLDLLSRLLAVEPAWTTLNPQLTQLVNYASFSAIRASRPARPTPGKPWWPAVRCAEPSAKA